jgi:hypothetical protein
LLFFITFSHSVIVFLRVNNRSSSFSLSCFEFLASQLCIVFYNSALKIYRFTDSHIYIYLFFWLWKFKKWKYRKIKNSNYTQFNFIHLLSRVLVCVCVCVYETDLKKGEIFSHDCGDYIISNYFCSVFIIYQEQYLCK